MDWSPSLTEAEREALVIEATTYALAHGLVYLPLGSSRTPISAIHAPFTLLPTPFPRSMFERAMELQPVYNVLYSRIASDNHLIDTVLGDETGVGRVDHFTGRLWRGWKDLRDQGAILQVCFIKERLRDMLLTTALIKPLQLGIFRSDYLLHAISESDANVSLKQVEFNTISSSFGSLAQVASNMHRYGSD